MAAVLIIVYAGAILVLFLFVIMLLNLRGREDLVDHSPPLSRFTKYLVSVLLFVELLFVIRSGFFADAGVTGIMAPLPSTFGTVEEIARLLFTRYLYPFELTSILIVSAIVGAVVIAKRDKGKTATPPVAESSDTVTTKADKVRN
jgi:NADH-quinone oxidoreductase subunit J